MKEKANLLKWLFIVLLVLSCPTIKGKIILEEAETKYGGGTGESDNPYQIATADDLMLLGESPEDYDKHFILTADIDLDPNLPGRKVFDRAVIAPETNDTGNWRFEGNAFPGAFDGNNHTISHLTITGDSYLGLFGQLDSTAEVKNLGVVDVSITGTGDYVGGLVGNNRGNIITCYATGVVSGNDYVGGLAGSNYYSKIANCSFTGTVTGNDYVGGLMGVNFEIITRSSSTGVVSGNDSVGGFVGSNGGKISSCYSSSEVNGNYYVGGFIGGYPCYDWGRITNCYSTGAVTGYNRVGGFVGWNSIGSIITRCYSTGLVIGNENVGGLIGCEDFNVVSSFWDIQTSGFNGSDGGVGLTTAEMMDPYMLGLNGLANDPNWILNPGLDYPRLAWEGTPGDIIPEPIIDWLEGNGTAEDPYRINTAEQLIFLGRASALCDRYFILTANIDLDPNLPDGQVFGQAVIPKFSGVFDGNNHIINNLAISGRSHLGLFGRLEYGSEVKNLGVLNVNITGSGSYVGSLVGRNGSDVTACYSSGVIIGNFSVGGLAGYNNKSIIASYSTGSVSGDGCVGGLVGYNSGRSIDSSYSMGTVSGNTNVGGLVGRNTGSIVLSYSTGSISGNEKVGGLVGINTYYGHITTSYSNGTVTGNSYVGGLVGQIKNGSITKSYSASTINGERLIGGLVGHHYVSGNFEYSDISESFWDIQTSGLIGSDGGVGLTTVEMMDPYMIGLNGFANDPNWVLDPGLDYPRLAWEGTPGQIVPEPEINWLEGNGTAEEPYQIDTKDQLILLGKASILWDKSFVQGADIDLDPNRPDGQVYEQAIIPKFAGVFDGNDHIISNFVISGSSLLGLFGRLESGAEVKNLGVVDVNITGSGSYIGGIVGTSWGSITSCYSSGKVGGYNYVGGLAGHNYEDSCIIKSYSTVSVTGNDYIGGLTGRNYDCYITESYSTGAVTGGNGYIGGLVGLNQRGILTECYSTSVVSGDLSVGGLVGDNRGSITTSFCTGSVTGDREVGGLVGWNYVYSSITMSYSTGSVIGNDHVGGLVGRNPGSIVLSYSTGSVSGNEKVGGLVGINNYHGHITTSYSTGSVTGDREVGGLVGWNSRDGSITSSFWDVRTSGLINMCGYQSDEAIGCDNSFGKTTSEMQTTATFLEAGWDFVNETINGPNDIWWIVEGRDYPRLWWEAAEE